MSLGLSVIIPVAPQDNEWKTLLKDFAALEESDEILIASVHDLTQEAQQVARALELKCEVQSIISKPGRAIQMNTAFLKAKNAILWFLHADTRLPLHAVGSLRHQISLNPKALLYFNLNFAKGSSQKMRVNEFGTCVRSNFFKLPFGDQGFCLSRQNFLKLGGFSETAAFGEDHLLVWRAHQLGIKLKSIGISLQTSARKYIQNGWGKTTWLHVSLTIKQATPQFVQMLSSRLRLNKKRGALVIFVKTPGLSKLKTRLASTIGEAKALEFYHLALQATGDVAQRVQEQVGNLDVYWAVAEPSALQHPLWSRFKTLWQGEGSLGERLNFVFQKLIYKYDYVCFIGADSPHLTVDELKAGVIATSQQLKEQQAQFIFGPTADGGFYFFSSTRPIPQSIWLSTEYSVSTTKSQLMKNLEPLASSKELMLNFDIDTESDLKNYLTISDSKKKFLNSQQQIFNWASKLTVWPVQ